MKVYLIRHGESEFNAKGLHQHGGVPLSAHGLLQTEGLAKRFLNIPVDLIIASPYERTKQTAEAITKVVGKPIQFEPLLREVKRPTEIEGKPFDDPATSAIRREMEKNYSNPEWRHSDEENFSDFKKRGLEALRLIENLKGENIVVVSHAEMIRMLVALMMFGDGLTSEESMHVSGFFRSSNTGITICEYINNDWDMFTWNDHAHLAEN